EDRRRQVRAAAEGQCCNARAPRARRGRLRARAPGRWGGHACRGARRRPSRRGGAYRARPRGDGGAGPRRDHGREGARGGGRMIEAFLARVQDYARGFAVAQLGNDWGPQVFLVGRSVAMILMILVPLLLTVLYYQLVERWVIGWIQVRKGPNRVG